MCGEAVFSCLKSVSDTVILIRWKFNCEFPIQVSFQQQRTCPMIQIDKHPEKGYVLTTEQFVNRSREEVFDFFSDATQLESITPPFLNFKILTPKPIVLRQGALIDYSLRIRMIPIRWRTEISVWEAPDRFVDQQLRGPYRLWHHEHNFKTVDGGTMVYDRVHYAVPGGALVHKFFVKNDLIRIFEYRRSQIEKLLNGGVKTETAESIAVG